MTKPAPKAATLSEAIVAVERFITETAGVPPSEAELADALQRYFVLNEIKGHIEMRRRGEA